MFSGLGETGIPGGTPGGKGPWGSREGLYRVYEESNDARHVGYKFHKVFSTKNKYRFAQHL